MFGFFPAITAIGPASRYRWARYALLLLVGLGGILILWLAVKKHHSNAEIEASMHQIEVSKHLIPISDVQLEDLQLIPSYSSEDYRLKARIHNNSKSYSVTGAEVQLTMKDCAINSCEIVGQTTASLWEMVPPSQTRGVDVYVYFLAVPPARGKYQWDYRIACVRAIEGQ